MTWTVDSNHTSVGFVAPPWVSPKSGGSSPLPWQREGPEDLTASKGDLRDRKSWPNGRQGALHGER